jgi:hypothetical protein
MSERADRDFLSDIQEGVRRIKAYTAAIQHHPESGPLSTREQGLTSPSTVCWFRRRESNAGQVSRQDREHLRWTLPNGNVVSLTKQPT